MTITQSKLTVEQIKSTIGRPPAQRANLVGSGLNKIGRRSSLNDTPAIRGMIAKGCSSRARCRERVSAGE